MLEILSATKQDSKLLLQFIKDLAVAEKFLGAVTITLSNLEKNLFGTKPAAEAVILHLNQVPCGFALYYYTFSSTTGKQGLHLDDLYIKPEYQGLGLGRKVLSYLSRMAVEQECSRFEWWALKTNDSAIKFYQKIGAKPVDEIIVFRLAGDEILQLSEQNPINDH